MALTDSLISYWKLDEAANTDNAVDAHGSNTLTRTNTPGVTTGKISGARDFERTSSQMFSISDNDSLSVGDIDFTVSAWVRLENKAADEMVIVTKTSASNGDYFLEYSENADRFRFIAFTAGGFAGSAAALANNLGSPAEATWYFIVAWHDATANTLNIQVNNGTVDSTSHSGGVGNFASTLFHIGGDPFNNFWDGLIDEVGFWKRVLTSQERTDLYNSGNGLSYDNFAGGGGGGLSIPIAMYHYKRMAA